MELITVERTRSMSLTPMPAAQAAPASPPRTPQTPAPKPAAPASITGLTPESKDWRDVASCSGAAPELFFPGKGQPTKPARMICARCPVREACLQWALDKDEQFGIWGGTSQQERQRIKRQSGQQNPADDRRRPGRTPDPAKTSRDEEIREARRQNVSVQDLSEKYGLSVNTIYRISGRAKHSRATA